MNLTSLTLIAKFAALAVLTSASAAGLTTTSDRPMPLFAQASQQNATQQQAQPIAAPTKETTVQQASKQAGKASAASAQKVKTNSYKEGGISFNYPSDMKISQESLDGLTHISLDGGNSTLLSIQMFASENKSTDIERDMLAILHEEFSKLGAVFAEKPTAASTRLIGGVSRQGTELSYSLNNMTYKSEIYTVVKGKKLLTMLFQYSMDDKKLATEKFNVVTQSFK